MNKKPLKQKDGKTYFPFILSWLIFLFFFSTSCQEAPRPEGKKESLEATEQVKQSTSKTTEIYSKTQEQRYTEEQKLKSVQEKIGVGEKISKTESYPQREVQFKEPILLWEREFEPPLIDISDQNSAGEYIAIQGGGEGGRPTKILFLDSKGKTIKETPLGRKEKRKIPPEQVWLTHYGEQWRDEKFKKSLKAGKKIETITDRAYVSGNGEYYAIITQDTAMIDREYLSPWYEFAYFDKTGKLLWKAIPESNYGFERVYISYEGRRVLIIDEAIVDYFGQRWYLYDDKGNLLKDEDHLVSTMVDQAERDKEAREWLKEVKISQNGKYFAYIKGEHNDSKAGLMEGNGKISWEKRFDRSHWRIRVSNDGVIAVATDKTICSVGNKGEILSKVDDGIVPIPPVSQSGKRIITEGELGNPGSVGNIRIYGSLMGNLILKFKIGDVLHDPGITWVNQIDFFENDRFMLISYNIRKKTDSVCIYSMEENRVIWEKEHLGEGILFRLSPNTKHLSLLDSPSYPQIKKVLIFEFLGGKNL